MSNGNRAFCLIFVSLVAAQPCYSLGPQNVLLIVNKNSPLSLAVANHYRHARQVPGRNVAHVDYKGSDVECSYQEFNEKIYQPCLKFIEEHDLKDHVSVWVTAPGIPYRVGQNSLSGVIFFGEELKAKKSKALGPAGFETPNPYYGTMRPWSPMRDQGKQHFLHMHLSVDNFFDGKSLIDRSVAADGTFPEGTIYLLDGHAPRDSRKSSIPQASALLKLLGRDSQHLSGFKIQHKKNVLGLFTGAVRFPCNENVFLPGSIADHLTSFGGALKDSRRQMVCAEFLRHGAVASYGTVVEPYNYTQKFPSAMVHTYYAMGFSAVESYWMSVYWPQQGLFVGDPLCRPFAMPPVVKLNADGLSEAKGTLPVEVHVNSQSPTAGISLVQLQVDGKDQGKLGQKAFPDGLQVSFESKNDSVTYSIPENAKLTEIIQGLRQTLQNQWGGVVVARGDSLIWQRPVTDRTENVSVQSTSPLLKVFLVGRNEFTTGKRPYRLTWFRVGAGPAEMKFTWNLETEKLADGCHELQATVVAGTGTAESSTKVLKIVVENHAGQLCLLPETTKASVKTGLVSVAQVSSSFPKDSTDLTFQVNGQPVQNLSDDPNKLVLDPKALGVGHHNITAEMQVDDRREFSENQLELIIQE